MKVSTPDNKILVWVDGVAAAIPVLDGIKLNAPEPPP